MDKDIDDILEKLHKCKKLEQEITDNPRPVQNCPVNFANMNGTTSAVKTEILKDRNGTKPTATTKQVRLQNKKKNTFAH